MNLRLKNCFKKARPQFTFIYLHNSTVMILKYNTKYFHFKRLLSIYCFFFFSYTAFFRMKKILFPRDFLLSPSSLLLTILYKSSIIWYSNILWSIFYAQLSKFMCTLNATPGILNSKFLELKTRYNMIFTTFSRVELKRHTNVWISRWINV